MVSGESTPTPLPPSLVAQNKPDPNLIRCLSVQQHHVVDARLRTQTQCENAAPFAGPRRMSMSAFNSSLIKGSDESGKDALRPMSLHGSIGRQGEMTTCDHGGLSWSSVPPLGAGPFRMSMPAFTSVPEESHKSASQTMHIQGRIGHQVEMTTRCHQLSLSSVPPLLPGP